LRKAKRSRPAKVYEATELFSLLEITHPNLAQTIEWYRLPTFRISHSTLTASQKKRCFGYRKGGKLANVYCPETSRCRVAGHRKRQRDQAVS
jgi:hypothetical protein